LVLFVVCRGFVVFLLGERTVTEPKSIRLQLKKTRSWARRSDELKEKLLSLGIRQIDLSGGGQTYVESRRFLWRQQERVIVL